MSIFQNPVKKRQVSLKSLKSDSISPCSS